MFFAPCPRIHLGIVSSRRDAISPASSHRAIPAGRRTRGSSMRAFVFGFAALAFGATLSACTSDKSAALAPVKTDPATVEKLVADLAAENFKGKATAAADI